MLAKKILFVLVDCLRDTAMPHSLVRPLAFAVALATFCLILPPATGNEAYTNRLIATTHSNFVKSQYSRDMKVQLGVCGNDENFCANPKKNLGGGSTCCFKKFCRDLRNDKNNCGKCGKSCGYGLTCCNGECVNLFSDNNHCGNCGTACFGRALCEFGLCGYGGYDNSKPDVFPKHL
ncbi:hypothetical protein O6H91_10G105100 [Diphasiastrum complanatum]|uniref:Uncharacterized protein n=2 Tax=Diphasiastrum complanatum TaxID=34168 RepID=A0ACC2CKA3_DIPCM|nr:hypothetical protein O6H91_10G104100 [Diphasiastrum complanatum]KAJ7542412.1 hypothetical protein O6H91_10G105100 [Diphasiastrum complanatum]